MRTSVPERRDALAMRARIVDDTIVIDLSDGRTVGAPLAWYPRLLRASVRERRNWRLTGGGEGIHWPDLDEDLSVAGVLAGRPSGESQASFEKWLASRGSRTRKRTPRARATSRPVGSRPRPRG